MSWSSSHRRERFNPGWARTRRAVLERDGYRCQCVVTDWRTGLRHRCLAPADEVDHIRRAVAGRDDDSMSNLQALCHYHHMVKTARESGEARRARAEARRVAAWYSHPAYR